MKNYSHRFHLLLHLEEIQMEVDIRKYDMHNEVMTQDPGNRKLLKLRVRKEFHQRGVTLPLSLNVSCFCADFLNRQRASESRLAG